MFRRFHLAAGYADEISRTFLQDAPSLMLL